MVCWVTLLGSAPTVTGAIVAIAVGKKGIPKRTVRHLVQELHHLRLDCHQEEREVLITALIGTVAVHHPTPGHRPQGEVIAREVDHLPAEDSDDLL